VTVHLLLPPSEGKAVGGTRRRRRTTFRSLVERREVVARSLVSACADPAVAAKALSAQGDLLDRALGSVGELATGSPLLLPAWQRYTGVVWEHLAPGSLDDEARSRLLVPSGLLGITTGVDHVPDYRLKLSVSLPGVGRLDRWWRPSVTAALVRHLDGRPVVDLLPAEHAAAVDWEALRGAGPVTQVRFVSADGSRAVGHAAKAVKGRLAHTLATKGLTASARFRWEGWSTTREGSDLVVIAPRVNRSERS
jgi:cytoplasmic iron level regulating protein YaaA (DUF328/UPF0246 family)